MQIQKMFYKYNMKNLEELWPKK